MSELNIEGKTYKASDEPLELLGVLRRHLDQTLQDSIYLKGTQLFTLKSWLLAHAEKMAPGKAVWLEETVDGRLYKVVAAIGKTEDGSPIVWHEPLPWPFGFKNESEKL